MCVAFGSVVDQTEDAKLRTSGRPGSFRIPPEYSEWSGCLKTEGATEIAAQENDSFSQFSWRSDFRDRPLVVRLQAAD